MIQLKTVDLMFPRTYKKISSLLKMESYVKMHATKFQKPFADKVEQIAKIRVVLKIKNSVTFDYLREILIKYFPIRWLNFKHDNTLPEKLTKKKLMMMNMRDQFQRTISTNNEKKVNSFAMKITWKVFDEV